MNRLLPRLLLTPAMATLFLWMIVPLVMTIYFSLIRYNLMQPDQSGFADLVAAARARGDKWFSAPLEDYGPSLSSLENYAREQTPAPVPAGWTPPQPPPPMKLPPMPPKAG